MKKAPFNKINIFNDFANIGELIPNIKTHIHPPKIFYGTNISIKSGKAITKTPVTAFAIIVFTVLLILHDKFVISNILNFHLTYVK